jgi:4-amino-4-deoxy-L-arabinose transferase-like glycosyltransferase
MENQYSKIYPQKWAQIILLLVFCFVIYFVNLGRWDLWNPDEPRYAEVAKEMVKGGDWVLMHYNGANYGNKPPLFFWVIALSSYLWQGFTSFSVRFPSALFGTLTVLLTFLLGKDLYSSRTGFLSGLILATSVEFAYISTRADTDSTLTFFTTASLFCFLRWYQHRPPHLSPLPIGEREGVRGGLIEKGSRRNLLIYGFYFGMALATLVKGPVGFILPLLVSLVYLAAQRDWKGIKGMRLLPGMLLMIAIVLAWYAPAVWKGGKDFLNQTLMVHTIDRFAAGWSKVRPFYYYLYNFPADFMPWVLFLPAALIYGFSREAFEKRKEFLFLFVWFVVILLFFSVSKGKRPLYLLPLYPATSLMIGKLWDDFISVRMERFRHEWISFPLYGFMGLILIAGSAIPWIPWMVSRKFPAYLSYLPHFSYLFPLALLMVGGSLAMFVLYRFKNYGAVLFLIIGIMAAGFFYASRVILPLVNPYKSARYICEEVKTHILPDERLGIFGDLGTGPYNFYTGIVPILELEKREDLFRFLESSGRVFCFLRFRDFSSFQTMEGWPNVQLIARRKVGHNDVILISNQ